MEILAEDLYHITSSKSFKEISQITKKVDFPQNRFSPYWYF